MSNPFNHPSGEKLLEDVSKIFSTKSIFQRKDRHIIFVCGGPVKKYSHSIRNKFKKYSDKNLPEFRVFLAEAAMQDSFKHNEPEFINIADFETIVAKISDCIILFPESAGSIAEMGFFANSEAIKKLLLVNDISKQYDTFINIGIIEMVNRKSVFRSMILTDYKNPDLSLIKQRLNNRLHIKTAKKFDLKSYNDLKIKEKLYIIYQVIYIFRALKIDSIIYCIDKIFGKSEKKLIKQIISILIATNYIERRGEDLEYFIPSIKSTPFLEFRNYDLGEIQAQIVAFYEKHHQETFSLLKEAVV